MNPVAYLVFLAIAAGLILSVGKLMGDLSWPWLVVTSPWWGLAAIASLVYALLCVVTITNLIKGR